MDFLSWCQSVFIQDYHISGDNLLAIDLHVVYVIVTRWTCRCWIFTKSKCLNCFTQGVHTPKNYCFDAWLCKHKFPRSFYNTSLGTILNSKSCVWSFKASSGIDMQLQVRSTFMDISITPHFSSGFCAIRIYHKNATMCTRWAWNTSAYFWVGKNNKSFLMQSCLEFVW